MCETVMYGLCRICLNDSHNYSHIYEELLRGDFLYEVLNDVCQLDVKVDDGLPEFVCCDCYNRISEFESFKRQSQEGSVTLQCMRSNLENVTIKVEEGNFYAHIVEEDEARFPSESTKRKLDKRKTEAECTSLSARKKLRLDEMSAKPGSVPVQAIQVETPNRENTLEDLIRRLKTLEQQIEEERKLRITADKQVKELSSDGSLFGVVPRLEVVEKRLDKLCDNKTSKASAPPKSALRALKESSRSSHGQRKPEDTSQGTSLSISRDNCVEIVGDKINLGQGYLCLLTSWKVMSSARCPAEWGKAILRGVFEEEAKYYRVKPRKSSHHLKPFPKCFLAVALEHYERFLKKLGYRSPRYENAVKGLAAMLSDRATDMAGRRGGRSKAPPPSFKYPVTSLNRKTVTVKTSGLESSKEQQYEDITEKYGDPGKKSVAHLHSVPLSHL